MDFEITKQHETWHVHTYKENPGTSSIIPNDLGTMHIFLTDQRERHLPTLMTLVDRKWLQGTLAVLTKESPSVVTVVLDLSDGLGESVTMAILAAAESMIGYGWWTGPTNHTGGVVADFKSQTSLFLIQSCCYNQPKCTLFSKPKSKLPKLQTERFLSGQTPGKCKQSYRFKSSNRILDWRKRSKKEAFEQNLLDVPHNVLKLHWWSNYGEVQCQRPSIHNFLVLHGTDHNKAKLLQSSSAGEMDRQRHTERRTGDTWEPYHIVYEGKHNMDTNASQFQNTYLS